MAGQDHAIAFRVMRLSAPELDLAAAGSLHFDLQRDTVHDAEAARQLSAMPTLAASQLRAPGFANRVQLNPSRQQGGAGSGLLTLPQAFGSVYLGQAFTSIVTACNYSSTPVTLVGIKVELSTDRSKVPAVLYDCTAQPLPTMQPGQRHDFTIRHDIKDLGAHLLTCSSAYVAPDGERRQLSQTFNFSSFNPLVVRTKQRQAGDAVLLEATLENATKGPMLLDAVTFYPSAAYTAERIGGGSGSSSGSAGGGSGSSSGAASPRLTAAMAATPTAGPLGPYIDSLPLIPEGGSSAFLFRLTKVSATAGAAAAAGSASPPAAAPAPRSPRGSFSAGAVTAAATAAAAAVAAAEASGALGKMDIRWRGPMGEVARLQTQQISLPQQASRDVSLGIARLPRRVVLGSPFTATLRVQSHCDRRLGPLKISAAAAAAAVGDGLAPAGTPAGSASSSPAKPGSGSSSRRQSISGEAPGGSPVLPRSGSSSGHSGTLAASATAAAATAAAVQLNAAALPASMPVCLDGLQAVLVDELAPRQAAEVRLRLLPLVAGQQALPALALTNERDGKLYSVLQPAELWVDAC